MIDKRPDAAAKNQRRTLLEADISSRRSTPRHPLMNSLGVGGAMASALVRGAVSPDAGGNAARPGQDRD